MTLPELQAKRDEILKSAGLASVSAADRSKSFSTDKQRELELIDREIAALASPAAKRFSLAAFRKQS